MARIKRNDRGGWYTSRKSGRKFNYAEPRGLMVAGVDDRSVTVHHGFVPARRTSPFETYVYSPVFKVRLAQGLERLPLPGKRIDAMLIYYADGGPSVLTSWDYRDPADDPEWPLWYDRRAENARRTREGGAPLTAEEYRALREAEGERAEAEAYLRAPGLHQRMNEELATNPGGWEPSYAEEKAALNAQDVLDEMAELQAEVEYDAWANAR